MGEKKFDFSGYATKVGIKCSDGRTISKDAFIDNHGQTVPLVWQHMHGDPGNILGHAELENRPDGVYSYCFFNGGESAQKAKELVKHGDIRSLSIYANSLVEKGRVVLHGAIREVSLVLAGANEGAKIENVSFEHSDGSIIDSDDEAVIYTGLELTMESEIQHAEEDDEGEGETMADVFDSLSDKQKTVVYAMLAEAIQGDAAGETDTKHSEGDQKDMKKNVFDKTLDQEGRERPTISHDAMKEILANAQRCGSLKEAFLQHAGTAGVDYGITNIDYLFPDYKNIQSQPVLIKRDTEWVKDVYSAAHHIPFSRIKTMAADITADEARARGYIKGKQKTEEVIALLKRTTDPTTVYKKQRLDRDDVIDITDFDVVVWLKAEMRLMLNEELARAILIGDGRSAASDDKIKETCIRPIYTDDDLYSVKVQLPSTVTTMQMIDQVIMARKQYKGSGNPVMFSNPDTVGDMLLLKDTTGRRLYNTMTDLAAALRVSKIVEVPVLENVSRVDASNNTLDLVAILVNMNDYSLGADKGGAINLFDDFDIDYNQYKYLIETRCSGALVLPKSALVIEKVAEAVTPAPED